MRKQQAKEVIVISKIKPYPIPAKVWLEDTALPLHGEIVRVTKIGFQMEIQDVLFKIGNQYKVEFTIPLQNKTITARTTIVKTMDRYKDNKATIKGYLIEMHFLSLSKEDEKAIAQFEKAINQKL